MRADAAAAGQRIEHLEAELSAAAERRAETDHPLLVDTAVEREQAEAALTDEEPIAPAAAVREPVVVSAIGSGPTFGTSLKDRIDAAENPQAAPADDSLDAIRDEAMLALEEARALKGQSSAPGTEASVDSEPEPAPAARPVIDYSPSAPAPSSHVDEGDDEDDDDSDDAVESRYSRNSAKLPRLGIEPDSASSTIANLRKQMTADN